MRARYYNPTLGRFTQEDVYCGAGLNLYDYCKGNPVIWYDPSGYAKCQQPVNSNNGLMNRKQAFNKARDKAGIPKCQQPRRQWTVGNDRNKKNGNFKNYKYSDNKTHHGRYYEYDTPKGRKVIVNHINDERQGKHMHVGLVPEGGNKLTYDLKKERYTPMDKETGYIDESEKE